MPVAKNVLPLDLQVRNSGLPGGYVWLSGIHQPGSGRWHTFGMAEFFCVTCPVAFAGSPEGYVVAVLDQECRVHGRFETLGGELIVEIDLGPALRIGPAPPLQDWLPGDSMPADPASVPCAPP